jgi:hypothetical protein
LNIDQLKHVLRAAAAITNETDFALVGSQAVLVQYPTLPEAMTMSAEIDMFPLHKPELAELVDGSIGSDSPFHETYGYYADGVGPRTARLPSGWRERAVVMAASPASGGATAIAPEIHDLCVAKLLAGREKDFTWLKAAFAAGLARADRVLPLLDLAEADDDERTLAQARLQRLATEAHDGQ